jgi:hypothetical protein
MPRPQITWKPPQRPRWAERLNAHGESVGGADRLVSLEPEALLATASEATGLADFGGGSWRQHFDAFLGALDTESQLHLTGRLLVRTELVRSLANRLRLQAEWTRKPSLLHGPIEAPVFIVGSPRSGTSILHELLACDPDTRAPAMWEMQHPVEAFAGDDQAELADRVVQFAHDLQPEYETMHANSGYLPNECIFITMHEFLSEHWSGQHVVPAYDAYLAGADHRPAYAFHKRFLQTLQARDKPRRWLLKAPSHLFHLRALFEVYPDALVIRTHRDPLKTLPSALDLMGTLKWMRCENVDLEAAARQLPFAFSAIFDAERDDRASGVLPDPHFIDVQFRDLVADPLRLISSIYERLGWALSGASRQAMSEYANAKPRGSRGAHVYSLESLGLDASRERERFRSYCEHYGVPEEH